MDFEELEKFIDLAKSAGVSSLKYESKNEKYSVTLGGSGAPTFVHTGGDHIVAKPQSTQVESSGQKGGDSKAGLVDVTSPFVGTFYASSSPGSDAYVKVGDKVSAGKVLCIVEAMKIMNEIESDIAGEIVEICVENENYVEFGQVLYRIKP